MLSVTELLYRAKTETIHYSNPNSILQNKSVQVLIERGNHPIIPDIIRNGIQGGFHWIHVLLLTEITGENPLAPEHIRKFEFIVATWMKWYLENYGDTARYNRQFQV